MPATATSEQSIDVTRRFLETVINGQEVDRSDEFRTDDFVQHGPFGGTTMDGDESMERLQMFIEAFPDMEVTEEFVFTDGAFVCSRYSYTGTHEGTLMGIEPSGNTVSIEGTVINSIDEGLIAETWASVDLLGLFQQIGAVELPVGVTA